MFQGAFSAAPRDKSGFKLRCHTARRVTVSVRQPGEERPPLAIERCFGLLVAPGKNVPHGQMTLLEMVRGPALGAYSGRQLAHDKDSHSVLVLSWGGGWTVFW